MDGGPFRAPQSPERRPTARQEPTVQRHSPALVQESTRDEPRSSRASSRAGYEEKSAKRFILPGVIIAVVVILLAVGGWFAYTLLQKDASSPAIDSNRYQAVFLTNDLVFFGKLANVDGRHMELTNIYYLERQTSDGASTAETAEDVENQPQSSFNLLKYSDVLYGSEDKMTIFKDQIVRYENLRPDGTVAKAIEQRQ